MDMESEMSDEIDGHANGPGRVIDYPRGRDSAGQEMALVLLPLKEDYRARFWSISLSRAVKVTIPPDTPSTRDHTRIGHWRRHKALLLAWGGICGKEDLPGA
jgi:hypothetical protein